jgi:hypothetical protein
VCTFGHYITELFMSDKQVPLSKKLNLETARAPWRELQPFFASGMVLHVREGLDLLLVGEQFAADNAPLFQEWLDSGQVGQVTDGQALEWFDSDAELWTLVIKPWVLVQPV